MKRTTSAPRKVIWQLLYGGRIFCVEADVSRVKSNVRFAYRPAFLRRD